MQKLRRAFTMIELIFVIVILGILASVALPKLAASKIDAEAAVVSESLADCIEMASGSYMKEAAFDINSASCQTASVKYPCFTISEDNSTGILNIKHSTSSENVCTRSQALALKNKLSAAGTGVNHQF
jgi:prepilin-type N-terminal cleavage/methylation domain-containing protein